MIRRALHVDEGRWTPAPEGLEASWRFCGEGRPFDLRATIEGLEPPAGTVPPPEAALAAALLPAMRRGRNVRIAGRISRVLDAHLPEIQTLLSTFFDTLRPVRVRSREDVASSALAKGQGVGAFLSLGVDSFFTFLRHRGDVDHVVLVQGFDIPLDARNLWEETRRAAQRVADHMGVRLVCVRTNVREWLDQRLPWDVAHGAAIAHVALLLAPWLRRVYVASSHYEDDLFPYGSHPDLDPLWSTERLEIVHDGCDIRRIDKIRTLADEPVAMDHLRVCWKNPGGRYNCGRCRKCNLVVLALDALGILSRCKTLPHEVHEEDVRNVDDWSKSGLLYLEEIREAYRSGHASESLLEAIDEAIARERIRFGGS